MSCTKGERGETSWSPEEAEKTRCRISAMRKIALSTTYTLLVLSTSVFASDPLSERTVVEPAPEERDFTPRWSCKHCPNPQNPDLFCCASTNSCCGFGCCRPKGCLDNGFCCPLNSRPCFGLVGVNRRSRLLHEFGSDHNLVQHRFAAE